MDTSRVSLGETIAAVAGAALLVLMFLPWFGGRLSGLGAPVRVDDHTGWEAFGSVPEFLIIATGAVAIGVAAARLIGRMPPLPFEQGLIVMGMGAVAVAIVLIRLVDPPSQIDVALPALAVDTSRKAAAYLALAAAAAITYGGWLQRRRAAAPAPIADSGGP